MKIIKEPVDPEAWINMTNSTIDLSSASKIALQILNEKLETVEEQCDQAEEKISKDHIRRNLVKFYLNSDLTHDSLIRELHTNNSFNDTIDYDPRCKPTSRNYGRQSSDKYIEVAKYHASRQYVAEQDNVTKQTFASRLYTAQCTAKKNTILHADATRNNLKKDYLNDTFTGVHRISIVASDMGQLNQRRKNENLPKISNMRGVIPRAATNHQAYVLYEKS